MKICILCDDAHVAEAKESAKALGNHNAFTIGVSEKGEAPATHWFCFLNVDSAGYQKINDLKNHSIIEEMGPSSFLSKHKLKIIK